MDDDKKKKFMGDFKTQMSDKYKQMKSDRDEDDDMRKKMEYFKQNADGRSKIDS